MKTGKSIRLSDEAIEYIDVIRDYYKKNSYLQLELSTSEIIDACIKAVYNEFYTECIEDQKEN